MPELPSPIRRSRSTAAGRPETTRRALTAFCLILSLAWMPAASGGGSGCYRGTVNCITSANMTICSATLMCTGATGLMLMVNGSMNVSGCSPAFLSTEVNTTTLIARADTDSPIDRSCSWGWQIGGLLPPSGSVKITSADGLPVELMDFSVGDDGERDPDG